MNIIAIIQARMSSKRLPGKVLKKIENKTVLEHVISRLKMSKKISKVVVATSTDISDDPIKKICEQKKIKLFRGSLEDVLDRYYKAAIYFKADVIVRITADCPVIDYEIVDEVIEGFLQNNKDFFSLQGEFPDGLDCQVFKLEALKKSWKEAKLLSDREHVGTYIEKTNSKEFKIGGIKKFKNLSHHRWTLDEPEDLIFLETIFSRLYKKNIYFNHQDILKLLSNEKNILKINSHITRNEGYLNSKEKDIVN
jgi:spore coat polysaccharide biosynthesis protein SpsF